MLLASRAALLRILSDLKPLHWWDTFTYQVYLSTRSSRSSKESLQGGRRRLLLSRSLYIFVFAGHLPNISDPPFFFLFFLFYFILFFSSKNLTVEKCQKRKRYLKNKKKEKRNDGDFLWLLKREREREKTKKKRCPLAGVVRRGRHYPFWVAVFVIIRKRECWLRIVLA